MFATSDWTDGTVGAVVLVLAFIVIVTSLFAIVKILNSLLQGHVAKVISKTINKDLPGKLAFLTGYVALLVGCAMTMLIQVRFLVKFTLSI